MIEKLLDKYFSKKAIEYLKASLVVFNCDKKIVKTKYGYELHIKDRKYNDNFWKVAYTCNFNDGLDVLIGTITQELDKPYIEELLK